MDTSVKIKFIKVKDSSEFVIDGTDWGLLSKGSLSGFGEFENDITTVDNAIGDGGIIASDRIAQKDRTVSAVSMHNTMNDVLRHKAMIFFSGKNLYKVYISYLGITRWFTGKMYKFELSTGNTRRRMELTVTLLCPDPYFKSYDNFGKNIASASGMVAFPYLCSITNGTAQGVTGGRFNFAQSVSLYNDGDSDTYLRAVFKANAGVVNPKLIVNSAYVRVIDTMSTGDVIEMDFENNPPTVTKNDANYIGHCDRLSSFDEMGIVVGDNEVSFSADTGTNNLDVSIYYNKNYCVI